MIAAMSVLVNVKVAHLANCADDKARAMTEVNEVEKNA